MKKGILHSGLMAAAALALAACSSVPTAFAPVPGNPGLRGFSAATPQQAAPMQVVELHWQNRDQIAQAAGAGLDLFGALPAQQVAKARVTPEQQNLLHSLGIEFQPVIEPNMDSRGGLPSGYMTYDQMTAKLKSMAQQYPQLVTLEDAGDTYLKKTGQAPTHDIWAITITNKKNPGHKPTLMLTGGIHARELAPPELIMKLAEELTSKYGSDPQITQLMDTREVVLLPMVNVDGRVEVEKGDSWKRKNMDTTKGDGIDINRNFDTHWNYAGLDVPSNWITSLQNPYGQTYSGSAPASEPETQVVQSMYSRKKIEMSMDIHSYGEMFFWPLGFSDQVIPEAPQFKNIYQNTFAKLGYQGGTSLQLLYPTSGTSDDYGYDIHKAFSMGLEVGHSFRPSYSEVESMWNATRSSWLSMINFAGTVHPVN